MFRALRADEQPDEIPDGMETGATLLPAAESVAAAAALELDLVDDFLVPVVEAAAEELLSEVRERVPLGSTRLALFPGSVVTEVVVVTTLSDAAGSS